MSYPSQKPFVSDTTAAFLNSPPVEWEKLVNIHKAKCPGREWFPPADKRDSIQEVSRELDRLIIQAARLREYLDQRDGCGCGDQGHADAVMASNITAGKIRKALGFSQERDDIRF